MRALPEHELEQDVAVLYVDPGGPYPSLVANWYDEARDGRSYDGPLPVVAHPPCGPWGAFAHLCKSPAQDPALALRALEQVRRWGGVLEHPRGSRLYKHAGLPLPGELPDAHGGRSVEVDQLHWGHVAHKRTWLYLVGAGELPPAPYPYRKPTHDLMGGRGRNATAYRGGRLEASKELRRRTPIAFAEWLVGLARNSRRPDSRSAPASSRLPPRAGSRCTTSCGRPGTRASASR